MLSEHEACAHLLALSLGRVQKLDAVVAIVPTPGAARQPVLVRMRPPFERATRWVVLDAALLPAP